VSDRPALSVVLVTDSLATVEPVVARLRRQTAAEKVELVLATTAPDAVRAETDALGELGAVVVVSIPALAPLSAARAAGVRAASAPIVFLGETHSYPEPDWAGALVAAHADDCAAVVPGFCNANPTGALSWAAFVLDYGGWLAELEPGGLTAMPTYNAAYKRELLLALGDDLDRLLAPGDELAMRLRRAGARFTFAPSARIGHVNVDRAREWLVERYLSGLVVGRSRSERWSPLRRLMYVAAAPLIPIILLARARRGLAAARRNHELPPRTVAAMVLSVLLGTIGEIVAYLRLPVGGEQRMTDYEIHRLRYVLT
jgi:hypothetical protein